MSKAVGLKIPIVKDSYITTVVDEGGTKGVKMNDFIIKVDGVDDESSEDTKKKAKGKGKEKAKSESDSDDEKEEKKDSGKAGDMDVESDEEEGKIGENLHS